VSRTAACAHAARCPWVRPRVQQIYRSDMTTMLERLKDAMNAHDAQQLASLCAENYQSAQPLHPSRGFGESAKVLENWSSVFDGVPDFSSELVASSVDGAVEWGEWHWQGHHVNGSPFAMRGVTIFVVRDGLIAEGRLYMEPMEADGGDIDAAVQELYKPPPGSSH
jgi:ketosteroid isomerase-like protein